MKNKPVHQLRLSNVQASIWENHNGEFSYFQVTFSRRYKDEEGWKSSESFGRDDLLLLAKLADHAHTWICSQRSAPTEPTATAGGRASTDSRPDSRRS